MIKKHFSVFFLFLLGIQPLLADETLKYLKTNSHHSHSQNDLDIDSLLSTPIEPLFQNYFFQSSKNEILTQKPVFPNNKASPKNPYIRNQKNSTYKRIPFAKLRPEQKELAKKRYNKHIDKIKKQFGYSRKEIVIRKELQSLSKTGKISKEDQEKLNEMNKRYRNHLDKKKEQMKNSRLSKKLSDSK